MGLAIGFLSTLTAADPAAPSAAGAEAAERASSTLEDYHDEGSEQNKERVKAALAELDAEIEQLQRRAEAAPDPLQRRAAEGRVKALEKRRDALRREFHATRFEELKADVRREWNEFKERVRTKTDEKRAEARRSDRSAVQTRDTGNYVRSPETGGVPVAVNRDSLYAAGEETPAEKPLAREQALAQLDLELERLAERAEKLDATDQERVEARLKALRDQRTALRADFSSERYRSLLAEIQAEIQKPRAAAE
jgi:hypothetical protein